MIDLKPDMPGNHHEKQAPRDKGQVPCHGVVNTSARNLDVRYAEFIPRVIRERVGDVGKQGGDFSREEVNGSPEKSVCPVFFAPCDPVMRHSSLRASDA